MNTQDHRDPIDKLVAEYLRAEATQVDAVALARRVCETRRRKAHQHRRTRLLAIAAVLAVALTVALLALTRRTPADSPGAVIHTVAQQTREMAGGVGTVWTAISGLRDAAPPVLPTFEQKEPGLVRTAVDDWKDSFNHDAAYVSGKMRASVEDVLDRAGLTL